MTRFISKMSDIQLLTTIKNGKIFSIFKVKILRLARIFYTNITCISAVVALLLILSGCLTPTLNVTDITWKTYINSRYGFEFPYPSNWKTLVTPTNTDGIALVSPKNNSVEIRAWGSNQILESSPPEKPNFQTTQGLSGILRVEVGNTVSSMTLTLTQNQVKYNWQGRSPSQEFADYYPLFYYIAQQYRVSR